MAVRLLLVDDDVQLGNIFPRFAQRLRGYELVGIAATALEGVALAVRTHPDVALLDVGLPDLPGPIAARRLLESCPTTRIVGYSAHHDPASLLAMLGAGALGYAYKPDALDELQRVLDEAAAGRRAVTKSLLHGALEELVRLTSPAVDSNAQLTLRELEVLVLVAQGFDGPAIAEKLALSQKTVAHHRNALMQKLQLFSVAELTRYAMRRGLLFE